MAEDKPLYGYMTVEQMIAFTKSFYSDWRIELEHRLTDRFQLPHNRKIKALSKGMRTKLALLLALARRPELLILDEPSEGLDPVSIEQVTRGNDSRLIGRHDGILLVSSNRRGRTNRRSGVHTGPRQVS